MTLMETIRREAKKLSKEQLEKTLSMAQGMDAANQISKREKAVERPRERLNRRR